MAQGACRQLDAAYGGRDIGMSCGKTEKSIDHGFDQLTQMSFHLRPHPIVYGARTNVPSKYLTNNLIQ